MTIQTFIVVMELQSPTYTIRSMLTAWFKIKVEACDIVVELMHGLQDWEPMGRHWGATLISEQNFQVVIFLIF